MKLIKVVYSEPLVNHEKVDYVEYHQVDVNDPLLGSKYCDIIAEMEIKPVLIVGYGLAKKLYGTLVNVLDKNIITNHVFWEFAYQENRAGHIEGLFSILNTRIFEIAFNKVQYELIDPVFSNIRQEYEVVDFVKPIDFTYIYKDMGYIYNKAKNTIYGVDMNAFDFFGFNKDAIRYSLTTEPDKYKLDQEGDIFVEYKLAFPFANQLKRYLVLLLRNPL